MPCPICYIIAILLAVFDLSQMNVCLFQALTAKLVATDPLPFMSVDYEQRLLGKGLRRIFLVLLQRVIICISIT